MALLAVGRKHFVSQSALSAIVAELRSLPAIPAASSRPTIKRQRQAAVNVVTEVGPMFLSLQLDAVDGPPMELKVLNPVAWLCHLVQHASGFANALEECMDRCAPTSQRPYEFILYADEVTPGNPLKADNRRKYWCFYVGLKTLGVETLCSETAWFTLACMRSHLVAKIAGGVSALSKQLVETFYNHPHDLRHGVLLRLPQGRRLFFGAVTTIVADEAALKAMLSIKGASGTVFCVQLGCVLEKQSFTVII